MRNRSKTGPVQERVYTPSKESDKKWIPETQAYATVWKFFFIFLISSVFAGVIFRLIYSVIFEEYPNRRQIATFTQFKIINRYMLIWPVIFAVVAKLLTKNERESSFSKIFVKVFCLNVVAQIVMTYICFYLIYYTSEAIKAMYEMEVMSGHIYAGLLSTSSILSTTIFAHHFRSRTNQIHKIIEGICFLYILHMGYSFFWTSFAFHSVFDTTMGLIIGSSWAFFIQWADGLCYFEINEPIIMYAARFIVGIIKAALIESCELLFGLSHD